MIKVIKRDGRKKPFDNSRITQAIKKAYFEVYGESVTNDKQNEISKIVSNVTKKLLKKESNEITVEEIQDTVLNELKLVDSNIYNAYKKYREDRTLARKNSIDDEISSLINGCNEYWANENSNKNAKLVTTQRDYLAGIVSKDVSRRKLLPKDVVEAHDEGIIHFHDMDYFLQKTLTNCELINLEDMLQNGTVINEKMIEKPHRFLTAMTIATQIITAVTSSTYGGATITLTHLAPFVRDSYNVFLNKYKNRGFEEELCIKFAQEDLKKEIKDGVQTFNYQINSMSNTNGQSPFLSVFIYLGENKEYTKEVSMIAEEFFKQRLEGIKNRNGVPVTQAFPKILYVLEEQNINEDSEYWWLTVLGAKCTSKRFVPDYISEKKMKELKEGNCFPCMGCRSFLSPYKDENGNYKFYARFNQGVVTINLPDVALSSNGEYDNFWTILDERLELCHKALLCRHKRLEGTLSDVAPILWQDGALGRLKQGETIDKLLHGGYSSISLGYVGIYETTKVMTGNSHTDNGIGKEFALKVMRYLNQKCEEWTKQDNIGYGLYGCPQETTTYKFAKSLQRRHGIIEGITDRDFVTNSYHVFVEEKIDAFTKLKLESEFQDLSTGGAVSYIEAQNLTDNIDAVLEVIKFMYENIMYAEINIKSDYCMNCGYDGEIKLDENLDWYCPNCGNKDKTKMNVTRRTCSYLGSNYWNKGRTEEISKRAIHLGDIEVE